MKKLILPSDNYSEFELVVKKLSLIHDFEYEKIINSMKKVPMFHIEEDEGVVNKRSNPDSAVAYFLEKYPKISKKPVLFTPKIPNPRSLVNNIRVFYNLKKSKLLSFTLQELDIIEFYPEGLSEILITNNKELREYLAEKN